MLNFHCVSKRCLLSRCLLYSSDLTNLEDRKKRGWKKKTFSNSILCCAVRVLTAESKHLFFSIEMRLSSKVTFEHRLREVTASVWSRCVWLCVCVIDNVFLCVSVCGCVSCVGLLFLYCREVVILSGPLSGKCVYTI